MHEHYSAGGKAQRPLTKKELEEMKKNMKKVDIIHQKAQHYHQKETQDLDAMIIQASSLRD